MIDVSDCRKINDENRGVNEKLWIDVNGRPALFKKTQIRDNGTHTNAHYGEAFVSEMCQLLNYKCAEVEIAERNGEIGCISYSFLKEDDELVDFISLIQNVRPSFDSKKMLVPETNETYSIPLILDALEEEAASEEEFRELKRDFLKSCIVDSLIEHYDRNPSNISVIRNNGHIALSPMFDNGTSLNISIPRDVIQENGNNEEWFQFLREKNKSKIGVEGEKYSNYDKLLDYILSNYYEDVADFVNVIQQKLTKENITKILGKDDYAGMDNVFKELIVNKLTANVKGLAEKSKEYENKYTIEQYMKSPDAYERLKEKVQSKDLQRIIPEINACIDCPQRNPYHIYSVSDYMFHCIEGINNIERIAQENGIKLKFSDENKRLMQWSVLFNELGKPQAREETIDSNGNIRDTFKNYSVYGQEMAKNLMERLNFYETDRKIVTALISSHQRRDLDTESSIRRLINEIGERNIDLYFGMKLAEIKSKNPELEKVSISKLKILKEKVDKIIANDNKEVIRALPLNGEQMKRLGLKGQQIGEVLNSLAQFVKSDSKMYAYYKSRGHLEKYRKDIAKQSQACAKEIKHNEKLKQLEKFKQPEENKMEITINACLKKGEVVEPNKEGILVVDTGALPISTFDGLTNANEICKKSISLGHVDHHTADMLPAMTKQPKRCATQMVVDYFDDILKYCKEHNVKEVQIHQDSDLDAITAAWILQKGLKDEKLPKCAAQMAEIVNKVDYAEYRRPVEEYITSFPGCVEAIYSASGGEKAADIKSRQAWGEFAELDNKVLKEVFPVYDALAERIEKGHAFDLDKRDIKSFIENSTEIDDKTKEHMHQGLEETKQAQTQFEKDIEKAKVVKFNFMNPETKRLEEGQMVVVESRNPLATTNLGYAHYGKNTIMAVYAGEERNSGDMYDIGIAPEAASVLGGVMREIAFEMNKEESSARLKAKEECLALARTPNMNQEQRELFEKRMKLFVELNALKEAGKTRPGQPGGDLPGINDIDPTPIVARDTLVPASNHSLMTAERFGKVLTNYAQRTKMNTMSNQIVR